VPTPPSQAIKVFVGGLSPYTTCEQMRLHFERYGAVSDCVVIKERHTGASRGFGFVTFGSRAVADWVMMQSHAIGGRTVELKQAIPAGQHEQYSQGTGAMEQHSLAAQSAGGAICAASFPAGWPTNQQRSLSGVDCRPTMQTVETPAHSMLTATAAQYFMSRGIAPTPVYQHTYQVPHSYEYHHTHPTPYFQQHQYAQSAPYFHEQSYYAGP